MTTLDLLGLLGGTLAKGAMILLLAAAGARLLRQASAAARHAIWTAGFAALAVLPAFTLALPPIEPTPTAPAAAPAPAAPAPSATGHSDGAMAHSSLPAPRDNPWRRARRTVAPWLLIAWLAGALLSAGTVARDLHRIARITRRSAFPRRGPLFRLGREAAEEMRVRAPVRVGVSRELAVPVTWGVVRPVVLLPVAALHWGPERRRVVLRHEMAHVRRRDYATHLLAELACAGHWPNPLVWLAARRARLEQERACDDRVLSLGTRSAEYSEHLLGIARSFGETGLPRRGALAMAAPATLPGRIGAILDPSLDHRPARPRMLLAAAGATLLIGLPTAAVRPWGAGREAQLVARLATPDPAVRRDALWALGALGAAGATRPVASRLGDADPATRGVAAWALGKLGGRDALAPLLAALRDPDAHVREMSVLALGELGDRRAVPALAARAGDSAPGVRAVLTLALRQIAGEPAARVLATMVRQDPDPHARVMAANALSRLDTPLRAPALLSALADTAAGVRAKAVLTLGELGDRRVVPALLASLRDPAPEVRVQAASVLGELGDESAVGPLIAATRDPEHVVRLTAVQALDALR